MEQIAAFESWINGNIQLSSFYTGEEAIEFIAKHEESNTFANLHIFSSIEEGKKVYNSYLGD
jgi:hypothetical protein